MKKLSFFWILALVICSVISCAEKEQFEQELQTQKREQFKEKLSHEVTQTEARENLEKLLTKLNIPSTRGGDSKLPPITSVYTTGKAAEMTRTGEAVEPYFHIFNFGDEEGFAIMSGDDRVEPLLALTTKGEFNPDEDIDNPGFEIAYSRMGDYYVQQVSSRGLTPGVIEIPPKDSLPEPIVHVDTAIFFPAGGPCPVKWGQGWPYNIYCRIQPSNSTVPVGSAGVAVAQLMSIYKYPSIHYSYYYNKTYEFDWDEMNAYRNNNSSNPFANDSTKYNQIARLIYLLNSSPNLNVMYDEYSASVPGRCYPDRIPIALENFGYASGGEHIDYDSDTIINELLNGYPVLIGGSDVGMVNNRVLSHGWLGHGLMKLETTEEIYQFPRGWITFGPFETYYIKCNFGKDGQHDGYYLSGVFDTNRGPIFSDTEPTRSEVEPGNYQYYMDAIVNIRKQ